MSKVITEFLKKNQERKLNIHCVGDAIVDEYYEVKVNRISPEHPVPVMLCQNDLVQRPGGAANVAYQFKHLNVEPYLICFEDEFARNVFQSHGIKQKCPPQGISSKLPIKRRYVEKGIQVAPRLDIERPLCGLTQEYVEKIIGKLNWAISKLPANPDVVILSDYDKGFFSSKEHSVLSMYPEAKTVIDPKKGPIVSKWKGCTVFKPNAQEAVDLSGYSCWEDQAKFFYDQLECKAVVITHGGEKVVGITDGELFEFRPTFSVNAESVIGAGDCFCAYFAAAIGHNFSIVEAVEIGWTAGSVYVQRRMNRPVCPAEISPKRLVQPEDLANRDFKLAFTNGCFDILHAGHIETLKFAKSKGDKLVVAINSDESVKRLKGPTRPINSLEQRMAVIAGLREVDFVVSFEEDTPLEVIQKIKPDVLIKGGDYALNEIVGADLVSEVYQAPIIQGLSSSNVINHLQSAQSQTNLHLPSVQQQ